MQQKSFATMDAAPSTTLQPNCYQQDALLVGLKGRGGEHAPDAATRRKGQGTAAPPFGPVTGVAGAISTVVRYELTRAPRGKALAQLARVADEAGLPEFAQTFRQALAEDLGTWEPGETKLVLEPKNAREALWVSAILAVLRNSRYAPLIPELAKLLREPAKMSMKILEAHKASVSVTRRAYALLDQGKTPEEVAEALGVPVREVREHVFSRELKAELEQANRWAQEAKS